MRILIVSDKLAMVPTKDELDTALEVEQVTQALMALGHEVFHASFVLDAKTMGEQILSYHADLIFNLVETLEGSRLLHLAPALFASLKTRYTGGNGEGMLHSSDKLLAKRMMRDAGIPTPPWVEPSDVGPLSAFLGKPLIIKPVAEEASIGITDTSVKSFSNTEALRHELAGNAHFAETFILGREFSVSLLTVGNEMMVFEPAEMLFVDYPADKPTIVGYEAKWDETSFEYLHTQRSFTFSEDDDLLLFSLKELSRRAFQLFGGKGYARVDFRVDEKGNPFVLEVNLNPCIARDSGFVAAAERAELSYEEMIALIIKG